jgi:ABC-type branched-subunit amino acid transport system ATPase component/ABC-type branched-subunit amino acid transport system permease subunit
MSVTETTNDHQGGEEKAPTTPSRLAKGLVGLTVRQPRRSRWSLAIVVIAIVALLPEYAGVDELSRVQQILLYAMVAFGLNIGLGYAGQFAVAQPVVLGVAAYTAGIMSSEHNVSPWVTLPAAIFTGCLTGFLLSAPGVRIRGWYLAVTTFFAAAVFPDVVDFFSNTTGGTNGLAGIHPLPGVGLVLGTSSTEYWIILGFTLVLLLGMYNLSRSTWGVILRGVRDAPLATEACGINVSLTKAIVSIVASVPVAVAGWATAHAAGVISTDAFSLNLSIIIVAGVVIGGMGSVWGPVIGTVLVEIISLWIGPFSDYNNLLVGAAVVFFAIVMPLGIVHAYGALMARISSRLGWKFPAPVAGSAPPPGLTTDTTAAPSPIVTSSPDAHRELPPGGAFENTEAGQRHAGDVIFEITNVRKHFSGVSVLDSVDLVIRAGEVVGLTGPNGSGKTTLLNIITGHVSADEGQALLFGGSILGRSPHAIAARGVRRTFQVPRLIGALSVVENIRLGLLGARRQEVIGSIFQLPGYRARTRRQLARIEQVCDLVNLDPQIRDQRVDSLPLGIRRVVEVARAVVSGPAIVCLDEPGAGLGGEELVRLGAVMRRVADSGSGVLVIEHNLDFVRNVTDRVVEMLDGRVVTVEQAAVQQAVHPAAAAASASDSSGLTGQPALPADEPKPRSGRLVVRQLQAFYGPARALDGVDLVVEPGETLGLLGNNGAGKTTLLRTVAGLHRRVSGSAEYDGHSLLGRKPDEIAVLGVGLVRDGGRVFENLTILEHLALAVRLGKKRGESGRSAAELLEMFPVLAARKGHTKAGYLSGGQRQLLCLAMAVGGGARCLLLDEPSAGLAESTAVEVFSIIRTLADQGLTLLIAEQDQRWLRTLTDSVANLEMGRIVGYLEN